MSSEAATKAAEEARQKEIERNAEIQAKARAEVEGLTNDEINQRTRMLEGNMRAMKTEDNRIKSETNKVRVIKCRSTHQLRTVWRKLS